jgi:hypothetical protein
MPAEPMKFGWFSAHNLSQLVAHDSTTPVVALKKDCEINSVDDGEAVLLPAKSRAAAPQTPAKARGAASFLT